jgi:hypothetical protein
MSPLDLFTVILLNAWLELSACAAVPLKFMVVPELLKVPPLILKSPEILWVKLPPTKLPFDILKSPFRLIAPWAVRVPDPVMARFEYVPAWMLCEDPVNAIWLLFPWLTEGLLVELIAALVAPVKPLGLAVSNVPFIVATPEVPRVITEVPASNMAPESTVKVFDAARVILESPVVHVAPIVTLMLPVTLVAVIEAPWVRPEAEVFDE